MFIVYFWNIIANLSIIKFRKQKCIKLDTKDKKARITKKKQKTLDSLFILFLIGLNSFETLINKSHS